MPTEITHVVAADGSGDYTTLSAWQTAQAKDIQDANEIARVKIKGTIDLGADGFALSGWTTSSDCYIEIIPFDGQEALGRMAGDGFAKIISSRQTEVINLGSNHARIEDIYIENTLGELGGRALIINSNARAVRCSLISNSTRSSGTNGTVASVQGNNSVLAFCKLQQKGSTSNPVLHGAIGASTKSYVYNNTIVGNGNGAGVSYEVGTGAEVRWPELINNVVYNCTDEYVATSDRWHANSRNNAGEGDDADDIPGSNSVIEIDSDDIDTDTWFSKTTGKLFDAGYDHGFGTLDIRRQTITDWSIGAGIDGALAASITIDGNLVPDTKIIVNRVNDPTMTTGIRLTDQSSNTILLPLDYDEGEDEYSFDMPALPAAGSSAQGLLFGASNITLTLEDLPE